MDVNAPAQPGYGNAEVIQFLEKWLAEARKGGLVSIALATGEVGKVLFDFAGDLSMVADIHMALDLLKDRIDAHILDRTAPYDPSTPDNQVCFNLSSGVVSFDFLPWLINAEMHRVRVGAPSPLKIAFFRSKKMNLMSDYHTGMFNNVMTPMLQLLGAETNKILGGKGNFPITYKPMVEAVRAGESVPKFKPLLPAMELVSNVLDGVKPITITLREANHFPHRNSNLEAWMKFADYLDEPVVFIRDTAKAKVPLDDYDTFSLASTDIHIRTALYAQAKHNFFISNGPMNLNLFLDTPCTMFIEIDEHCLHRWRPGWPEYWENEAGIKVGEQFPWFNEQQRIVWKSDTFENLVEAWEAR